MVHKSHYRLFLIAVGILWLLLAATLLVYQVIYPAKVEVAWETATEQRTAGFNLYRSSDSEEGFSLANKDQIIESQGDTVSGASYTFIDSEVKRGKTYTYILEEIELDGSRNRFNDEILEYYVPEYAWWMVGLAIFSGLCGLGMLLSGLKENKKL